MRAIETTQVMDGRKSKLTKQGKLRGRPLKELDFDFDTRGIERQYRRQMARKSDGNETRDVISLRLSKRGGESFGARAIWILNCFEKERRSAPNKPNADNLEAIKRWLRDPKASSLEAALRPRKARTEA